MKLISFIFCHAHYYYLIGTISSSGMMIYSSSLSWKSTKMTMTTAFTSRAIRPLIPSSSLASSLHPCYYRSYHSSSFSSTKTIIQRTTIRTRMNAHTDNNNNNNNNNNMIKTLEISLDWNDRIRLQNQYTLKEKGWKVHVDWRPTPFGAGLFSKEDIPAGTILRKGILDVNLKEFKSIADIDEFCNQQQDCNHNRDNNSTNNNNDDDDDDDDDDDEQQQQQETIARLNYVKDYLWGFDKDADERGYPNDQKQDNDVNNNNNRFFGMWIPGNGLNHNINPNTVYKSTNEGIDLIALVDIGINDELFDDYRRHGSSSTWLKEFAHQNNVTLNFADCNDFV